MIAIVSPILAVLTVLAMFWMASSVRVMNAEGVASSDSWDVLQGAGWLGAGATALLAVALMVNNPSQAPWEHPLPWLQVAALVVTLVFAYMSHVVLTSHRRRRAGVQYTQMGYLQPSGKRN
jgi:hypothetical protein